MTQWFIIVLLFSSSPQMNIIGQESFLIEDVETKEQCEQVIDELEERLPELSSDLVRIMYCDDKPFRKLNVDLGV